MHTVYISGHGIFRKPAALLFAVFILLAQRTLFAQNKDLPRFTAKTVDWNKGDLSKKLRYSSVIKLESAALAAFARSKPVTSFHLKLTPTLSWDIDLQPSNLISPNYVLKVLTAQGLQTIASKPDFLYTGKVRGSRKGEEVRLAIKEGFVYGAVAIGGKEYFIEPLKRFAASAEEDALVVYEAKDVIAGPGLPCGVRDRKDLIETENVSEKALEGLSPQSAVCKRISFVSVADYSMYKKFGGDVSAVETALLANLNLAEGAFTTLNLGPDSSTDVGGDNLQFEMEEVVVSTCKECDVAPGIENVSTIGSQLFGWAEKNIETRAGKIIQYWTANALFDITAKGLAGTISNLSNCSGIAAEILRYGSDDPAFLRLLIAHETGHALGCPHDDDRKAGVTGFIMYSDADARRTRFSTLADFGGIPYSSQQTIRNTILQNSSCLEDCRTNLCEGVADLEIEQDFSDNVRFSWAGSGNFLVKYKINDSILFDPDNVKETTLNSISLKDLEPCALYSFQVQRACNGEYSRTSTLVFQTSSLNATAKPINIRNDRYDVELNVDCKNCSTQDYVVKIDNNPYTIANSGPLKQMVFKNFFADGSRHRINISNNPAAQVCSAAAFFKAPYYRSNSATILSADFNDCTLPSGWKDSLLAKYNTRAPDARWITGDQNFFTTRTARGNLDSSCMIYYNSFNTSNNSYSGSLSLTSPAMDITGYENIKLHYDYNFLAYKFPDFPAVGAIAVEAFDGNAWQKVGERFADEPGIGPVRNVWDSIPARVFIDLDKYKNKDFRIRFTVDDGSLYAGKSVRLFAAFDNIQIDGYVKDTTAVNHITVYPNPTSGELFVRLEQQPDAVTTYILTDALGRLVRKGQLNNRKIGMSGLSSGMYILRLYVAGKPAGIRKILKH